MTRYKRINAAAVVYKSYLLQGVAPYLNERNGLAVASVFKPVTGAMKASMKQDKETLLNFLRQTHFSHCILLTYSRHDRRQVADFFAERLAIVADDAETASRELALAWASTVNFFTKWQALRKRHKFFVRTHKKENMAQTLTATTSTRRKKKST